MHESSRTYTTEGVYFIPAVTGFLIKDNRVLLMERLKSKMKLGEGIVSGVGGKVECEEGDMVETYEEALVREFEEEVGVVPTAWSSHGFASFIWINKPSWNMRVKLFTITLWTGEPIETEVAYPQWFAVNDLPLNRMWPDNVIWVPKVLAGETLDMTFWLDDDAAIIQSETR